MLPIPSTRSTRRRATSWSGGSPTSGRRCSIWTQWASTISSSTWGGDSLAAMRIASQVLATWSLELSLAVILEAATVAQMAAAVRDRLAQPRT